MPRSRDTGDANETLHARFCGTKNYKIKPTKLPPIKPNKVRVVFDCNAEYKGRCLNKELLPDPDLADQLIGVLLRFRKETISFMADIEKCIFK